MSYCPKCGSLWRRVHPNDKIMGLDEMSQYLLARQVICTNEECSFTWQLSPREIILHYIDLMRSRGKTKEQAEIELVEEYNKSVSPCKKEYDRAMPKNKMYRCKYCGNLQTKAGYCLECGEWLHDP